MSQICGDSVSGALPIAQNNVSTAIQEKLATRQAKRTAKAAERREKSDVLKEEGNAFFRAKKFLEALDLYQQAAAVHKSTNPVLLANLAATYLNLGMYPEAHDAAEKALVADPKSVKARYRRGMARKHMGMLLAAEADFRALLRLDPNNNAIRVELRLVEKQQECPSYEFSDADMCSWSDQEAPAMEDEPWLEESLSESSDCEHTGNGIPCKFYNRAECKLGHKCRYSHAPDDKSERDALGRNVCKYYLIGVCKFGDRCSYLHSKKYLLQNGWWSTAEGLETERRLYDVIQINNVRTRAARTGQTSKKSLKRRGRKTDAAPVGNWFQSGQRLGAGRYSWKESPDASLDGYDSDEGGMLGFTKNDMHELLCQGVKPWDDDAWDVLNALHSY